MTGLALIWACKRCSGACLLDAFATHGSVRFGPSLAIN